MDRTIEFQGGQRKVNQEWTPVEVLFLLKYYPKYKSGNSNYQAGWIRGHLKGRSMNAISNKYWSYLGTTKTEEINPNQSVMPFLFDKLEKTNG